MKPPPFGSFRRCGTYGLDELAECLASAPLFGGLEKFLALFATFLQPFLTPSLSFGLFPPAMLPAARWRGGPTSWVTGPKVTA